MMNRIKTLEGYTRKGYIYTSSVFLFRNHLHISTSVIFYYMINSTINLYFLTWKIYKELSNYKP